jgi:type I restriction enzyme S subunit
MAGDAAGTIGEYFTLQRGTSYKSALLDKPGPILLGLATIARNGGFRDDSLRTYGGDSPSKLLVHPGDLYLSLKDVTQSADLLGAVARLPKTQPSGRLTQDTVRLVPVNKTVPMDYLYWVLRTPQYREYCRAHATGTTNLGLAREDFLAFPVPSLTSARTGFVRLLGTLDDKIELNRRMNATLEGISRAIFKSWFVDFDPVRQKAAGKQPVGMDAQTAALFPDSFEDSEIGKVPKGWRLSPLDDVADYLNGLALQKYPAGDGPTLPVIKIAQLRKGDATGADRCNDAVPAEYVIEDGDVLFSWSGSLEVVLWCGGRGALNQHLFKVTSQSYPKWFYYLWTLHHLADFRLIAADKATTMGHIQRKHLTAAKVILPPAGCIDGMTRTMEPLLLQSVRTSKESRDLASLRDTLLPKLLSGELGVPEAEQAVEEAIA